MVLLRDWFQTIDADTLNEWFSDIEPSGKQIDDILGYLGSAITVLNRISQVCSRLMFCNIVDVNGDTFDDLSDLDDETLDSLSHCIQHNLPALVNAIHTLSIANDMKNGITHNQTSANPNRDSSVMVKDNSNFNNFEIQKQQNILFETALQPFIDLRDELLQFVDFQVW